MVTPNDWIELAKAFLKKDPVLRGILARQPHVPLQARKRVDLFASLTHAIVNQQLSGRVAEVIFGRLRALFPRKRLNPALLVKMSDAKLRKAGLSFNKIKSIKDLARRAIDGRLPSGKELRTLSDEALIERLTDVHGIGPWTVHMLLIFKLGRPDVFPSSDLGVQKGFQKLHGHAGLPTQKALAFHAEKWKPYRTLAAWYCWRAVDEVVVKPVDNGRMWRVG